MRQIDALEAIAYELRLIRWHMEFQVKNNKQEAEWREYLKLADNQGHISHYLENPHW